MLNTDDREPRGPKETRTSPLLAKRRHVAVEDE